MDDVETEISLRIDNWSMFNTYHTNKYYRFFRTKMIWALYQTLAEGGTYKCHPKKDLVHKTNENICNVIVIILNYAFNGNGIKFYSKTRLIIYRITWAEKKVLYKQGSIKIKFIWDTTLTFVNLFGISVTNWNRTYKKLSNYDFGSVQTTWCFWNSLKWP